MWMGTNGGWYPTSPPSWLCTDLYKGLIIQYDSILRFNDYSNFIILGIWHTDWPDADRVLVEKMMLDKYGRNYINLRKYLVDYGLGDANITPTTQDTTNINAGKIPSSLLADSVHLNSYGQQIVANQIYLRGQELGYW